MIKDKIRTFLNQNRRVKLNEKIIGLLAGTSLIVGSCASVVSCGNSQKKNNKESVDSDDENIDKELKAFFNKLQNVIVEYDTPEIVETLFLSYIAKEQVKLKDDHIFKNAFYDSQFKEGQELNYLKENQIVFNMKSNEDKEKHGS